MSAESREGRDRAHLYVNAKKYLRADGQAGRGNRHRTLLSAAAQSPAGWAAFRDAVIATPGLAKTASWVRHWDKQMTAQTARRAQLPSHYSTGALDPQIELIRRQLERRRWTFRNLDRMNALLGLVRLHVNRRDVVADWAGVLARDLRTRQEAWAASAEDFHWGRPRATVLSEPAVCLLDNSRV